MNISSEVQHKFMQYFNNELRLMKNCDHGNILTEKFNPYHLEGDVWTHTTCAISHLPTIFNTFNISDDNIKKICSIAVMFHDVGKIYCRKFDPDKNKVMFYNHENYSVNFIINNNKKICDIFNISLDELIQICLIIQAHTIYYQINNPYDIFKYLNYDEQLLKMFTIVVNADQLGRITIDVGNKPFINLDFYNTANFPIESVINYQDNKEIILMVGCPASGKDAWADKLKNKNTLIISYDQLRIETYLNFNKGISENTSSNQIYQYAFIYCQNKNIDITQKMIQYIKLNFICNENINKIVIANTNLSPKARRPIVNLAKQYKIKISAITILNDLDTLILRDKKRRNIDKSVGEFTIDSMFYSLQLPTKNEGFYDITYNFT